MAASTAARATFHDQDSLLGGVELKAAGLVAASAQGSGVTLGKGRYLIECTTTAVEIDTNDEVYSVNLEANTAAATSTWYNIGTVALFGATEITGQKDSGAAETTYMIVENPYDNQVRYSIGVAGTIATGINIAIKAYPIHEKK